MAVAPDGQRLRARSALSTYLIVPALLSIPWVLWIVVAVTKGEFRWADFLAIVSFPAFWLLWASVFRIDVAKGVLTYRTLFRGSRSLPLAAIGRAEMTITPSAPFGPFFRLTIYPKAESDVRPIVINMKVFRREDLDRLADILGPKFTGPRRYGVFGKPARRSRNRT